MSSVVQLNIKMPSYQYSNSHYKDKMVAQQSDIYNGLFTHGKTVFILRSGPQHESDILCQCAKIVLLVIKKFDSYGLGYGPEHIFVKLQHRFPHLKFYGIVYILSYATSWSLAHLSHMGLLMCQIMGPCGTVTVSNLAQERAVFILSMGWGVLWFSESLVISLIASQLRKFTWSPIIFPWILHEQLPTLIHTHDYD